MFKRWLACSIGLVVSLSVFSESSYAYTRRVGDTSTFSSSEVARIPVRITQPIRNRIMGTVWMRRMNRSRIQAWVNGGEEGLIYRSTRGSIIGPYAQLRRWIPRNLPGGGNRRRNARNAHHILTEDHVRLFFPNHRYNLNDLPAVNLPRGDHMDYYHRSLNREVNSIRRRRRDLNTKEARDDLFRAYERVYAQHPDWLDAIRPFFED